MGDRGEVGAGLVCVMLCGAVRCGAVRCAGGEGDALLIGGVRAYGVWG